MHYNSALISVIALAFLASNVDNLLLLVSWLLTANRNATAVAGGLGLGMLVLLLAAYLLAWSVGTLAQDYAGYFGYLGVLPLSIGLLKLLQAVRAWHAETQSTTTPRTGLVLGYAGTQIASGGDTVTVYAALLVETQAQYHWLVFIIVGVCTFVWFVLAKWLAGHASKMGKLEHYAEFVAALIMVGIGIFILADTAVDLKL